MRRPVVWGVLFLVAGLLFLGLAQGPADPGEGSLASQAPGSSGSGSSVATSGAQLGISLISTLTGVLLIFLALFCFGTKVAEG